jgi:hypothetical protein
MDTVKLKVPPGTTSVNNGGKVYKVTDGFADVPRDVADALILSHHGYSESKTLTLPKG